MSELIRPLQVAFFVEGMSASGVDTSTQLLADALRWQGHRVVFFVPWKERCTQQNRDRLVPLTAVRVSTRQPVYWSLPVSWNVYERFHQEHFDLVHVHTSTTVNLLAWQAAALQHLPLVYTYHTMSVDYAHYLGLGDTLHSLVEPAIEFFDRVICNKADVIVAPSRKAALYLHGIGVEPPVRVIPNGINLETFHPQPSHRLHQRLELAPERPILLFVGRLNQEKRPLLAYDLFRRIHQERPDAVLVMVGDGAQRAELEARIAADDLHASVRLAGLIPYSEMPQVFNSADLWISTSMSEVHPMVALEAAACGLPAVAWNDPALAGVVEHEKTGMLVNTEDTFVRAALHLLASPSHRRTLGTAAASLAGAYRIERTAHTMHSLYRALLFDETGTPMREPRIRRAHHALRG